MGQTSTSPFMNIRNGTEKKVLFNARDELGDKIEKLTAMMGRLAAKKVMIKDHLNPKYIKVEVLTHKVKTGPTIREIYQNRSILGTRSDSRTRGQYGNNRPRFQQNSQREQFPR